MVGWRKRDEWPDLFEKFHKIAAERGVRNVAPAIPADPKTVYRLINGDTRKPSLGVREGIKRIVRESEARCPDTELPEGRMEP